MSDSSDDVPAEEQPGTIVSAENEGNRIVYEAEWPDGFRITGVIAHYGTAGGIFSTHGTTITPSGFEQMAEDIVGAEHEPIDRSLYTVEE